MITEWNEAWWADRPQDHELGAAWCANSVTRAFIPKKIAFPCFFYVKQNDMNFRGDYSLLMQNNVPKASFNAAKIFNSLSGRWLPVTGTDDDVSAVACWDESKARLAVVLVNFRDRYALRRRVQLRIDELPPAVRGGIWRQSIVDATHANIWHDVSKAELAAGEERPVGATLTIDVEMQANSIHLLEVINKK